MSATAMMTDAPAGTAAALACVAPPVLEVTEAPPPRLAWMLPAVLMAMLTVGIVWSVVGHVDIVAPTQGTLVPSGKVKLVQATEQRVVRAILVREGQAVRAGDVLLEFDVSDAVSDRTRLVKEAAAARLRVARLRATLTGAAGFEAPDGASVASLADEMRLFDADRDKLEGEVATLRRERDRLAAERESTAATVAKLEALLPLVRQRVEARRALVERQFASLTDYLELQQELVTTEAELKVQRAELGVAAAALAAAEVRIEQARRTHRMELTGQLVDTETRAASLGEELSKAVQRLATLELRAPEDGTVQELALHTVGAVVQPAQVLMKVVPAGAVLEVEAKVLNRDVGFVEVGQAVKVKPDTFTYTKYGALPGRVVAISTDAVADERLGPVYRMRVALERQTMTVDGRTMPLVPGMTATVDVHTGSRRVIDYLLMPLTKYREEAMRER